MARAQKYLPEVDFLRGVSIIGVLLIHVVSEIAWRGAARGFHVSYALFLNQLSRYCVPAFIFVSGMLLTYRHRPEEFCYYRYCKRRTVNVIVPYAFWTILSILNLHRWGHLNPEWIRDVVFLGRGYYFQLYFIPLIVQLYLLSIIFVWAARRKLLGVVVGVAVIANLVYLGYHQLLYLGLIPGEGPLAGPLLEYIQPTFPAWIGYYALGCWAGSKLDRIREALQRVRLPLLAGACAVALGIVLLDYSHSVGVTGDLFNPGENFMRPSVFLYSLLAIALFWRLAERWRTTAGFEMIRALGNYSFGIYLVHLIPHYFLRDHMGQFFYEHWAAATLAFALVTAISFGLVHLVSRDPDGWILIGKTVNRRLRERTVRIEGEGSEAGRHGISG